MSEQLKLAELARESIASRVLVWLQRFVALYCLGSGVRYWALIVGYPDTLLGRFDLMPVHWQVASVTLAVFFPFAAIGLWMLASWGPVIWFICASAELVMFLGYPELFGRNTWIVVSHLLAAALYLACRFVVFAQKRRSAVSRN